MPKGPCPQGIITRITFASCWDGHTLDHVNHHDHVHYPHVYGENAGRCPHTHPVRIPTLVQEYKWATGNLKSDHNQQFVLSTSDVEGTSLHADFVNVWDEKVLADAIDQCRGEIGTQLHRCPAFKGHIDYKASAECNTLQSVNEKCFAEDIVTLAGCNVITTGPFKGAGNVNSVCDGYDVMTDPTPVNPAAGGPDDHRIAVLKNVLKKHKPHLYKKKKHHVRARMFGKAPDERAIAEAVEEEDEDL